MLQDRFRSHLLLLALGDLLLVGFVYLLAFWLRGSFSFTVFAGVLPQSRFFEIDHLYGLLFASHLVLLYSFGLYDERLLSLDRARLARLSLAASALQVLLLVAYRYFTTPLSWPTADSALNFPRSVYLLFLPMNAAAAALWRSAMLGWLRRRIGGLRVAVVGMGPSAAELIGEIRRRPEMGLEIVGVFADPRLFPSGAPLYCGVPVLGSPEQLVPVVRRERISEIIIAGTDAREDRLVETIARSELTDARVSLVPGFYELLIGKVHRLHVHDIPLVEILREPSSRPYQLLKRCVDLLFAILLGLAAAPLAAAAAVLVRLADGGPALYLQERVGKDQKPFLLFKFRTMSQDAEAATGPVLSGGGEDARVTSIGRWLRQYRIDEIPQLWNVLRGDMSLVGPRPERAFFVESYLREISGYAERFKVKPGVTGLAQVRGTYRTSAQNKLRYDLAYIYNQSLWLDLGILVDTVKEVLNSRGH